MPVKPDQQTLERREGARKAADLERRAVAEAKHRQRLLDDVVRQVESGAVADLAWMQPLILEYRRLQAVEAEILAKGGS